MLLYASLHLSGYDSVSLDDIKQFRQLGSHTPGHPENFETPGVETTTGPARPGLRQRRRHGDGREVPAREVRLRGLRPPHLRHLLRRRPDGRRRVGGRLDRRPPRARPARLCSTTTTRSRSTGRPTSRSRPRTSTSASAPTAGTRSTVEDGNDLEAIEAAIRAGHRRGGAADADPPEDRDRLRLAARRHAERHTATRSPEEQVRATKEALGWDPDAHFLVPDEVVRAFRPARRAAPSAQAAWQERFDALGGREPRARVRVEGRVGRQAARRVRRRARRCSIPMQGRLSTRKSSAPGDAGVRAVRADDDRRRGRPDRTRPSPSSTATRTSRPSTPGGTSPGASASTGWAPRSTGSRCTAGSSSRSARRSSSSPTTCARRSGSRR